MIRNYEFFENYYLTHNLPKIQYFYNILMLLPRIMAKRIIAVLLSDGRLKIWAVNDSDGSMQTRWKQTTHPDASWTNWQISSTSIKNTQ
jgi:hypothetical protein